MLQNVELEDQCLWRKNTWGENTKLYKVTKRKNGNEKENW